MGSCSRAWMVMSRELTCLRDDGDTLGLHTGMICPTMTCLERTRVTAVRGVGGGMGMPTTETAIMTDGEAVRVMTIGTARTTTPNTRSAPGTGHASALTTRTRGATDAGQDRMNATTGRAVGGAAGAIPALRHATPEAQATLSSSRGCRTTLPLMRLVAWASRWCSIELLGKSPLARLNAAGPPSPPSFAANLDPEPVTRLFQHGLTCFPPPSFNHP